MPKIKKQSRIANHKNYSTTAQKSYNKFQRLTKSKLTQKEFSDIIRESAEILAAPATVGKRVYFPNGIGSGRMYQYKVKKNKMIFGDGGVLDNSHTDGRNLKMQYSPPPRVSIITEILGKYKFKLTRAQAQVMAAHSYDHPEDFQILPNKHTINQKKRYYLTVEDTGKIHEIYTTLEELQYRYKVSPKETELMLEGVLFQGKYRLEHKR